jgi:hypothetical protein
MTIKDGDGCGGKRRFPSREEALIHAPRHPRARVVPYFCRYCGSWHNGSKRGLGCRYRPMGLRGVPSDEVWEALG